MKCPNCGNVTQTDAVFCDQCGTRLPSQEPVAPVAAAPVSAPEIAPVAPLAPSAPVPDPAPVQPEALVASSGVTCPGCGASNTPGEIFCSECGAPLAEPEPQVATLEPVQAPAPAPMPSVQPGICPVCSASLVPGDTFCHACGAEVGAAQQTVPAAPAVDRPVPVAPAPVTPVAAAPVEPIVKAPVGDATECPTCGAVVTPGDTFCEFCGAALTVSAPAAAPIVAVSAPTEAPTAIISTPAASARFVLASSGLEISLPEMAEVIVGREDPFSNSFPEIDLTPHGGEEGGVSRSHFKVARVSGGFTIEDLNSTNLTLVNRQRLIPGTSIALTDGDEILAGRVKLIFRVS